MDWCAANILLEMKYAALFKILKTTDLNDYTINMKLANKLVSILLKRYRLSFHDTYNILNLNLIFNFLNFFMIYNYLHTSNCLKTLINNVFNLPLVIICY
jgi:hypothetical protein